VVTVIRQARGATICSASYGLGMEQPVLTKQVWRPSCSWEKATTTYIRVMGGAPAVTRVPHKDAARPDVRRHLDCACSGGRAGGG
jgi:hypothetical protein